MKWKPPVFKQRPGIRLSAIELPAPRHARIPYRRALRWGLPCEGDGGETPVVRVFVTQRAYVRICAHAGSNLEKEVGGWLVGKWRQDQRTGENFIVVETALPARHTQQGSAFLTFTQDSQVALHEMLQDDYPDKELVGWFHTHPRMGVFLSEMDVWLHRNFFPEPWQVALVIEPYSTTGGFFIRQSNGRLDSRRYFGFYELINRSRRSIVHWRNLIPIGNDAVNR